jgi:hypothetical protein
MGPSVSNASGLLNMRGSGSKSGSAVGRVRGGVFFLALGVDSGVRVRNETLFFFSERRMLERML